MVRLAKTTIQIMVKITDKHLCYNIRSRKVTIFIIYNVNSINCGNKFDLLKRVLRIMFILLNRVPVQKIYVISRKKSTQSQRILEVKIYETNITLDFKFYI
jgi:hypothetical protein